MDTNYEFLEEVDVIDVSNDVSNDVNLTELIEVDISPDILGDAMDPTEREEREERDERGQRMILEENVGERSEPKFFDYTPERQLRSMDRHLRFYPMSLVNYEQLTAMDPIANRMEELTQESTSTPIPEPVLRTRPMTRGYARQLYQEANQEQCETSDNYSDSDSEIIFGKPYKMTVYESALVDFVIKPIVIFWMCVLWICIVFGANRSVSGGERLNSFDVQRISKEFANVKSHGPLRVSKELSRGTSTPYGNYVPIHIGNYETTRHSPYQMNVPNQVCE